MRAAWRAFVDADAFGPFDTSRLAKILRRAGWPAEVRPYNAKHSIGIELAERGADMADIQAWFGHTSPGTTRIYTGQPLERVRRLAALVDGRLGWNEPEPDPAVVGRRVRVDAPCLETAAGPHEDDRPDRERNAVARADRDLGPGVRDAAPGAATEARSVAVAGIGDRRHGGHQRRDGDERHGSEE